MANRPPPDAGQAAFWMAREIAKQLIAQGVLDGEDLHKELVGHAANLSFDASMRDAMALAANAIEGLNKHRKSDANQPGISTSAE